MSSRSLSVVATVLRRTCGILGLLVLAVTCGCGGPKEEARVKVVPVEGVITLEGNPVPEALVVLHPKDKTNTKLRPARGKTDVTGAFKIGTYEAGDGAAPGDYAVTVTLYELKDLGGGSFEPGPNVLSPKIATPDATDISVTVADGPNTLAPIEVKR